MDERTPPHDTEAEQSALGGAMLEKDALSDVIEAIRVPGDFYHPKHALVFEAILDLHRRSEPVDAVKVAALLQERKLLTKIGGAPYLHTLVSSVPTAANAGYYARIVRDRATLRRLIDAGTRIAQLGYDTDGADVGQIVELARGEVDAVSRQQTSSVQMLSSLIGPALEAADTGEPAGTPTPWTDLNHLIGGWQGGRLYLIAARPAVGKSLMAIQAAAHLAESGLVAFSSLEMSGREVTNRIIAQRAEVALGRLEPKHGNPERLTPRDWDRISKALPGIEALGLAVNANPASTPTDISAHARTLSRQGELAAVVVDYLQLMEGGHDSGRRSRQEVVSGFSRSLKLLAMELDVPVIALSQLNRLSEQRNDRRPMLSDLRESGSLEQDSDVVILLHQEDVYGSPDVDAIVAKNRQGVPGIVQLTKEGHYARLMPRERRHQSWSPSDALEATA